MDSVWEKLLQIAEASNGHITTKQATEAGFTRPTLSRFVAAGQLVRVCQGHYVVADSFPDEYALLQSRCAKAVFSYGTALFFWGFSDRVPHLLDMTVPQRTNVSKIKRDNADVRFHYVQRDLFDLGKTQTTSPQGNNIILYDKERCICDLIRARNHMDMQLYTQAIRNYFVHGANVRKLLKYGKQMGIEDKIRTYMEVLL